MPTRIREHDVEGFNLNGEHLEDVNVTTPTDGQLLLWDAAAEEWQNEDIPAPELDLEDINDVDLTSPSEGQVLTFDGTNWANDDPAAAPSVAYAKMGKSNTAQSFSNNVTTVVEYDNTVDDPDGLWSSSDNGFVIAEAGVYCLGINCSIINAGSSAWRLQPSFTVNGSNVWTNQTLSQVSSFKRTFGSTVVRLNVGDIVRGTINQDSGSSADIELSDARNHITIARIGP